MYLCCVTSRKGRVSRNDMNEPEEDEEKDVTSRKGRVSRNGVKLHMTIYTLLSRPARGV